MPFFNPEPSAVGFGASGRSSSENIEESPDMSMWCIEEETEGAGGAGDGKTMWRAGRMQWETQPSRAGSLISEICPSCPVLPSTHHGTCSHALTAVMLVCPKPTSVHANEACIALVRQLQLHPRPRTNLLCVQNVRTPAFVQRSLGKARGLAQKPSLFQPRHVPQPVSGLRHRSRSLYSLCCCR